MKTALIISYFFVPALVYFTMGYSERGLRALDASSLQWFIPNYFYIAAPQLLWAILSRLFKFPVPATHAGYFAATAILLSAHVWYECCADNRSGMDVLMYWLLALVLMPVSFGVVLTWWRPVK